MNILYFISIDGQGQASGGHYHSLNQISREVAKANKVGILSIGSKPSPVLVDNPFFIKHIYKKSRLRSIYTLNKKLTALFNEFKPEVLHCFDTNALNNLLVLPLTYKYPILLNKCGGKNPLRKDYQHANGIVVFSAENYDWFIKNKNYKGEIIQLIPNRVQELKFVPENKRIEKKENDKITFLRVSRLGGAYEKTLEDSFRMIRELMITFPVQLIVIGRIQDDIRYQWFKKEAEVRKLPIKFITDKRASKGSDFLYLADFVIGTGRSFMEAISLGIPSLTPAQNARWPVFVNENNFYNFFKTNFSERNWADDESLSVNKDEIIKLINNKTAYKEAQESAKLMFHKYFGTEHILTKYNAVYKQLNSKPTHKFRLILKNLPYLLKYYFI